MPFSTHSNDSGYYCRVDAVLYDAETTCTSTSDLTNSVTGSTDDDEPRNRRRQPNTTLTQHSIRGRNARNGKPRRSRRKNTSIAASPPLSGDPGALGDEDRKRIITIDDMINSVYVYFQSLLVTIQKQQRFCENVGSLLCDLDARWGANLRRHWLDPSGCFIPHCAATGGRQSGRLPGCWAIPHPTVCLSLLAGNIKDYLTFLRR